MFSEIETEFAPQFEGTDLDFKEQYNNAMGRVQHYQDDNVMKEAIRGILSGILAEYSRSKGNTKAGRVLRFISRIFAPIIKVFK